MQTDSLSIKDHSLFTGHNLKPIDSAPLFNNGTTYYWPGIFLFLTFALYVSIKITNPRKIYKVFAASFSLQAARQLMREDYKLNKRVSVFLSFGFLVQFSFLAFFVNKYFGLILTDVYPLKQFLFFLGVWVMMYIVKFLTVYVISFIADHQELGRDYTFNSFLFFQTTGILLFPIVVFMQYSRFPTAWFMYPGLILFAGFYFLRLYRGFTISVIEQNIGILYIFLYFCALEILPLLVLIKFLWINFSINF